MFSPALRRLLVALLLLLAAALALLAWRQRPQPPSANPDAVPAQTLSVSMTAYTSEAAQTDRDPALTASGTRAGLGTAAVSQDLLERLPYGTQIRVVSVETEDPSCGGWVPDMVLTVEDTMHPRVRGHVDVWLPSTEEALRWGRCEGTVEVLRTP